MSRSLRLPILALLGVVLLAGAALATALVAAPSAVAADRGAARAPHHLDAGARDGHGAAGAYPWEGGRGTIPTLIDAALALERRASIVIRSDDEFNPANGVRSGTGTFDDPFVISGWFVDTVLIADTTKAFELRENYVGRILLLDWTAQGGYIHHNHLSNLRTNRNVERTGDPTAAVLENNTIHRVEELRHFDGELRHNVIGKSDPLARLTQPDVVLNIQGLNGAGIHDNVVYGGVDMRIHGHHHSDATGAHSHNHAAADDAQAPTSTDEGAAVEDHQTRYVDFRFYRNRIVDDGFGLRYNDLDHAANDRQATSEQEPALELPHVHHTTVTIANNVIEGATLRIAVLNSPDERHLEGQSATLVVERNRIEQPTAGDGIVLQDIHDARVHLRENVVEKGDLQLAGTSAILLQRFTNTTVLVDGNAFGAYNYGVRAREFDANTTWSVGENKGPVSQPVYWDNSVANAPEGHEASAHEDDHEHDHEDGRAPAARDAGPTEAVTGGAASATAMTGVASPRL